MVRVQQVGAHMGFSADHTLGTANGDHTIARQCIVYSIANSGDKCQDQITAWNIWPLNADPTIRLVVINCGINNVHTPETTALSVGHFNDLLAAVRATLPSVKILICQMTPAHLWEDDRSLDHQLWTDFNQCLLRAGLDSGPTAINAVDGVVTAHVAPLSTTGPNGNDYLLPDYDVTPAGIDRGLHPDDSGSMIHAQCIQDQILALKLL